MRGVRQRRPSEKENRQRDTRSFAVSEGIEVSLDLVLDLDEKRAQARVPVLLKAKTPADAGATTWPQKKKRLAGWRGGILNGNIIPQP